MLHICQNPKCGQSFKGRVDARFCSHNCRQAGYHNRRRQARYTESGLTSAIRLQLADIKAVSEPSYRGLISMIGQYGCDVTKHAILAAWGAARDCYQLGQRDAETGVKA